MLQKIIDKLYKNSIEYFINWKIHGKEFLIAILVVLVIRSMFFAVYRIPTGSMIPTFREGDMLVANRFFYGLKLPFTDELPGWRLPAFRQVETGDVIIVRAPKEQYFYDLIIKINKNSFNFLNQLNQESTFIKRPISLINQTNINVSWLKGNKNYIISQIFENTMVIHLHESLYQKYSNQFSNFFTIFSEKKRKATMTYFSSKYEGFSKQFLSTPIAGFSIIATVLLNTPFFAVYKYLSLLFMPNLKHSNNVPFVNTINFYPNRFIDTTKEYVKRVVAVGGDKVEIKNRKIYVNDQLLPWSSTFIQDPYDANFLIHQESMPQSIKSKKEQVFTHPLRVSKNDPLQLNYSFDTNNWPFDPDLVPFTNNIRDNFGPIIIPKNHYFALGDNRDQSFDSRYFGTIPAWAIKGIPMFIFLPFNRLGLVK